MRLRCDFLNHVIDISLELPTLLVIENESILDGYICCLNASVEKRSSKFHLLDGEKEIDLSKHAIIITSPLDLVFSTRSFQKSLYRELTDTMKILGFDQQNSAMISEYVNLLDKLNVSYDYSFGFETDISDSDLLSFFKVRLTDPEGRFSEKLVDYVRTTKGLIAKDIFIFCNCNCYINKEEVRYVLDSIKQEQAYVLFVERYEPEQLKDMVKKYIIDAEVCEINEVDDHMKLQSGNAIYSEIIV